MWPIYEVEGCDAAVVTIEERACLWFFTKIDGKLLLDGSRDLSGIFAREIGDEAASFVTLAGIKARRMATASLIEAEEGDLGCRDVEGFAEVESEIALGS